MGAKLVVLFVWTLMYEGKSCGQNYSWRVRLSFQLHEVQEEERIYTQTIITVGGVS